MATNEKLDKAIVLLLVVTLFITFGMTVFSISRIDAVKDQFSLLTGFVPSNASYVNTTLTVSTVTSLNLGQNADNFTFEQGYVNTSCPNGCVMATTGSQNQTPFGSLTETGCCMGWANLNRGVIIENTGNVNLSVNFTCTSPNGNGNCSAAGFIGGTNPQLNIRFIPNSMRSQSGEYGTTDVNAACHTYSTTDGVSTYLSQNITMANFSYALNRTPPGVCGNLTTFPLDFNNTRDALVADLNLTIPPDATKQNASLTLNFSGISAG